MKTQPEMFVVWYRPISGLTDLIGNGFIGYEIPDGREDQTEAERFVDYLNKLIEERAMLLMALQKAQATFDDLYYEPSHDGCDYFALEEAKTAANAAIEKATT
jgi:hypothetical protein